VKIIANHAHLMPDFASVGDEHWPRGSVGMLLKHLDFAGIDMAVVFPPFACQFRNSQKEANVWALKQVRQHPDRLLPAATLSPTAPDAVELLRLFADEGVRLVKIHPSIDVHDIADPAITPFYREAERLGMVLDYHTGPHATRLSLAKPEKFDDLAWDHPELKLVFEHVGGRTYFEEFLAIINNHKCHAMDQAKDPRVLGGITSVLRNTPKHGIWYLGPDRILDLVTIAGADTLIFGIDFPWNAMEETRRDVEIIMNLDIPQDDKVRILGGNLAKLLGVNLN